MTTNYLSILAETIRTNWDQPALTDFYLTEDGTAQDTSRGNHYTYGEMYAEVCRVAELLTALGLQKGDHIAICGANSAHWVIAYLAVAKMQGVSVTVMHTLQPDEIVRLVAFSDAKALFIDPDIWDELQIPNRKSLIENQECVLSVVLSLADWSILHSICSQSRRSTDGQPTVSYNVIAMQSKENLLDELLNGNWTNGICLDDLATICFTSGTTSKPKGVMIPHRSFTLNFFAEYNVLNQYKKDGKNIAAILPFSHVYGLTEDILRVICGGLHCHILHIRNIQNDLFKSYQLIHPIYITAVPNVLEYLVLLANTIPQKLRKTFVKTSLGGIAKDFIVSGAQLPHQKIKQILDVGVPLSTAYGMTEGSIVALAYFSEYKIGTAGIVTKGIEVRISPVGEILVKGENVMLGYYKDPEATAAKIDSNGWLHTGDKGHLDEDGYLYVEGRLEQDIIVLPNGENIRPDNIESLINALPEVSESIVIARNGHLIAITVVPNLSNLSNLSIASSKTNANSVSISSLRRTILRTINPQLPLFSQLYDVEITDTPLQRTEKQTIKRYLYS